MMRQSGADCQGVADTGAASLPCTMAVSATAKR